MKPKSIYGRTVYDIVGASIVFIIAMTIAMCSGCRIARAEVIDSQAIKAIIGEAENQGYEGMYAVACAIRNRGTLSGVYGVKAPRVIKHAYSNKTYRYAEMAWGASEGGTDTTFGATHWENVKAFGIPYWARKMEHTITINNHAFFRERI